MPLPKLGIGEWFKKAAEGAGGGILKGASELVSKFVTDPTAKMEAEKELETLRIKHIERLAELSLDGDRIEADLEKTYLADVDSARKMQVAALQQDDKFAKRFVYYFTIFWSVFSAVYIILITFVNIPPEHIRFADTILGFILGTGIATMFNFYLGSSKSSRDNSEAMIKNMNQSK